MTKCCENYNGTLDITNSCIFCKTYIEKEKENIIPSETELDPETKAEGKAIRGELEQSELSRKMAHYTKDGWCCACDYDKAVLEGSIALALLKERERIVKAIKEKGLHLGYKNDIIKIINQR